MNSSRLIIVSLIVFCALLHYQCSHKIYKVSTSEETTESIVKAINETNSLLNNFNITNLYIAIEKDTSITDNIYFIKVEINENSFAMIYVPPFENKIIINPIKLNQFANENLIETDTRLGIEPSHIFVMMFLHEIAHIVLKHNKESEFGFHDYKYVYYNLDSTVYKINEYQADSLAATIIEFNMGQGNGNFLAENISLALSFLSWNLQENRIVQNFGAEKSVLWDKSKTHPNFELRILHQNYLILKDSLSKELLHSFIERRQNVNSQQIWFKKN